MLDLIDLVRWREAVLTAASAIEEDPAQGEDVAAGLYLWADILYYGPTTRALESPESIEPSGCAGVMAQDGNK